MSLLLPLYLSIFIHDFKYSKVSKILELRRFLRLVKVIEALEKKRSISAEDDSTKSKSIAIL
jgi:hypothetical protein